MAQQAKTKQTKNSSTRGNSRSSSGSRSSSSTSRSPNGSSRAGTSSRTASKRTTKRTASQRSNGGRGSTWRARSDQGGAASATNAAREGVKSAGSTLGDVAKKARVPALAAGTGLAGVAGGIALVALKPRKRVLGVPLPTKSGTQAVSENLAAATKNVGSFGEGMSSLAAEIRKVREGIAGGNGEKGRSPIEIVLQGLTKRH